MGASPNKQGMIKREEKLMRVAEYLVRGWRQYQIVKETGWSKPSVCRYVKAIRADWAKRTQVAGDAHFERLLRAAQRIERTANDDYDRSKEDFTRTVKEHAEGRDGQKSPMIKAAVTTETRNGDPRFLNTSLSAQDQQMRILKRDDQVSFKLDLGVTPPPRPDRAGDNEDNENHEGNGNGTSRTTAAGGGHGAG